MGFFDWLNRMLGRQPRQEAVPPPPPPSEEEGPPYWEYDESLPPPPEQPQEQKFWEYTNCEITYEPGHQRGKIYVSSRWRAINPDAACIRDLFNRSGIRSAYSVIICGELCSEYPGSGHEGESEVCLTYKFEGNYMRSIVQSLEYSDGTEFANVINSKYPEPLVECWESCTEIAILDN